MPELLAARPAPSPALRTPIDEAGAPPSFRPAKTPAGFDPAVFVDARAARRHRLTVAGLVLVALLACAGILAWDNPMPVGSDGFRRIAVLRASSLGAILVVAWCQGIATVAFQTITGNRILTPSIMGFESLYRLVQTSVVFAFGAAGLSWIPGALEYLLQAGLMVAFAALLFGTLLGRGLADLHRTLLVGIVLGTGLGAGAAYMQRLLTPTQFDLLSARLIGSIANADLERLGLAAPLALAAGLALLAQSRSLDVLALGPQVAIGLGVDARRTRIRVLLLVAVLMAVSTSLVGPMSFLGFLVAMATYELAGTHVHSRLLPLSALVGVVVLGGAYFVLKHVLYAQGSVGVLIEAVGGTAFLLHVLRKGRL